ncbi:murein transglycosylase A [Aestuariivirga sp.]|uniref:murein transglycosylase A n=1 Tax=Aestuariivirga sp. TaxID=2650926 RepID=UPI003BAB59CB
MNANLSRVAFTDIPGWAQHDPTAAFLAFRRSCQEMLEQGTGFSRAVKFGGSPSSWREVCVAAFETQHAQEFFESRFSAWQVKDGERPDGLFTGYFEPEVEGSRSGGPGFHVPIYRRPDDLVAFTGEEQRQTGLTVGRRIRGAAQPYLTRREIEGGALTGQDLEIVWLKDWADAFFIQIQGSGRVRFSDGSSMRLSFAAKSGLPYTGIGGLLVDRGVLGPDEVSMQTIRKWMTAHPIDARTLMWENQSFVFFRDVKLEDPHLGALGAQHVQLTPQRSLAADRFLWMFGTPVWLDTQVPTGDERRPAEFRQLLIVQDTGSAIKGLARGDVYWGFGEEAARVAGPMKSEGRMTVLLPHAVAAELGLET